MTVAFLKDRSTGKRNREVESRVGSALPVPLPAFFPFKRESVTAVTVVLRSDVGEPERFVQQRS